MSASVGLILVAVACGVSGQIILKMGMTQLGRIGMEALTQPLSILFQALTHPLVVLGLGFYVLGAAAWLTVLSRVPLSFGYPILALSYVLTPVLAWLVLGETVPSLRWMGISTICLGVFIVSRS